jgi:hypothetical protein
LIWESKENRLSAICWRQKNLGRFEKEFKPSVPRVRRRARTIVHTNDVGIARLQEDWNRQSLVDETFLAEIIEAWQKIYSRQQ